MLEFIIGVIVILGTITVFAPPSSLNSILARKYSFYTLVAFVFYLLICGLVAFFVTPPSCVSSEVECYFDSFYAVIYLPIDALNAIWMLTSYLWGQGV